MNTLSFLRHSLLRGFYTNPFTLTYTAGANGSVVGVSPQVVDAGKNGSPVTAVPNANYRFLGWSDGVTTAARTDANVTGSIAVTANFVIIAYKVCIPLERGPHIIYAQATDSVGAVTTAPITYVMAYELTAFGIDLYSGDAKLDAIDPLIHDELLPALPTLNFSCATLLTGTIQAVIRERGLKQYQFTIATVGLSNGIYSYTCKAAETYSLTTAIMALQTAYGTTSNAIRLICPSLNIVNASLLLQTIYPQIFQNIQPLDVIDQLMIQALAQASVRNGNMYVFPLDVSGQIPDYHMQRLDALTSWQRDADIYGAVIAHYTVKQYPTPDAVLTLNDAANWTGVVTDVTQVATTMLPVPSGALGMLKSIGNCSRAALSVFFKDVDRVRFNWCPVTATALTVSLQQDVDNKLELTHTFAGEVGAGFILTDVDPTETLATGILLSPVQYVTKVEGTMTAPCSYRVTLKAADSSIIWQDSWGSTIGTGNAFAAHVPIAVSQTCQVTSVKIEFTNLYPIGEDYGVQAITCVITTQAYVYLGSHVEVSSNVQYQKSIQLTSNNFNNYAIPTVICPIPTLVGNQTYTAIASDLIIWYLLSNGYSGQENLGDSIIAGGNSLTWYPASFGPDPAMKIYPNAVTVNVIVSEIVQEYQWQSTIFVWSDAINLFEAVNLSLVDFTRTGNPVTLQTIALTFAGDNYVDTLVLVADNPLPITVQAGTGSRAYVVLDDFGSEAGAQAYADGLLPIISVAREQYTRDVPLSTDLSVGDTIDGDGVNMTVYAIDYRQDGKTLAAGKAMNTLMKRLQEQVRRIGALERKA